MARGKYTFAARLLPPVIEVTAAVTVIEKKSHGSRPDIMKTG
jgi:hypothetical protein